MKKILIWYKSLEKWWSDHPIAAMAIVFLSGLAITSSIFSKQVKPFLLGDHLLKGYVIIVSSFLLILMPSLLFIVFLKRRNNVRRSMIDALEMIDLKLSHDCLITDSRTNLRYYPHSILECYYSYFIVLSRLQATYGNEFKSFPTRTEPLVPGKDWVPLDEVVALHTDVKAILKRLKERR